MLQNSACEAGGALKVINHVRRAVLFGCLLTLITYGLNVGIVAGDMIEEEWRGLEQESGRLSY